MLPKSQVTEFLGAGARQFGVTTLHKITPETTPDLLQMLPKSQVTEFLGAGARQFGFMVRGLQELQPKLEALGIPFFLLKGGNSLLFAELERHGMKGCSPSWRHIPCFLLKGGSLLLHLVVC